MNRLLFSLLALALGSISSVVAADANVRAAQSRLKDGGFYFGETTGEYTSETAAAVTRYQIRHGLQITGQLDAATANALGVARSSDHASAAGNESDTWRRLRKSDQQFLSKLNAGRAPTPPARVRTTNASAVAPTAPATAAANEYSETFVLSRERLRDYVAAFVLAGLDAQEGAELEFFADRVSYFNEGSVNRDKIQRDLRSYNQRWPERRFWLAGEVEVQPRADSRLRVTFPLRYELRNASKRSSGKVEKTLVVEVTGEDLQIVGVNERKAR